MLDKSIPYGVIERYRIDGTTGCWNWVGSLTEKGYPKIKIGTRVLRAHKWFYERIHGKVTEGLELHHKCENRRCVNPDHLEQVTHAENLRHALKTRKLRHGY